MKIKRQDTSIPVFSYVMDIFLFSHPLQLLITQHSLVQFFLHPVNEIGAAFVLPEFDIPVCRLSQCPYIGLIVRKCLVRRFSIGYC